MSNVYFVSTSGNDANPGTFDKPWRTVQQGANLAQPGDTVYIRRGVYRESIAPKNSGRADAPITFKAYRNESVTISATQTITPGKEGVGQWQPHRVNETQAIYKIQIPDDWDLGVGKNQVFVNRDMMIEARWPNVPNAVNVKRSSHAISTQGSAREGAEEGLYQGTYFHPNVQDFWQGGYINFAPGEEMMGRVGQVTAAAAGRVNFSFNNPVTNIDRFTPSADDPFFLWGKLEALDTNKEFFFDRNGQYGPANTLYLWVPNGSPTNSRVEIKTRNTLLNLSDRSHIVIEDLNFYGGSISSNEASRNLRLDGIVSEYGGYDLRGNSQPAISLAGEKHQLTNSTVTAAGGMAVFFDGNNHYVWNNVIADANYILGFQPAGVRAGVGERSEFTQNTVFNVSGHGIGFAGFKAGKINYNRVFETGRQITDIAAINTYGGGDGQGGEIAYNYVHDVWAYVNSSHEGGRGIRLDGGGPVEGVSNYKIHHNVVWNISKPLGIVAWGLAPGQPNYGNSQILIANNTVDGAIVLSGADGIKNNLGTTVINNITRGVVGQVAGASIDNNLTDLISAGVVNPASQDFRLTATSSAINAATPIPGINLPVRDAKPDMGALEYGETPFVAGAVILNEHLNTIRLSFINAARLNLVEVRVSNLPIGRTVPLDFKLKINGSTIGSSALENFKYNPTARSVSLFYQKSWFQNFTGSLPIQVQLGNNPSVNKGTVDFSQLGLSSTKPANILSTTTFQTLSSKDNRRVMVKVEEMSDNQHSDQPKPTAPQLVNRSHRVEKTKNDSLLSGGTMAEGNPSEPLATQFRELSFIPAPLSSRSIQSPFNREETAIANTILPSPTPASFSTMFPPDISLLSLASSNN